MLSVHGLVRIIEVKPVEKKNDNFWVLTMTVASKSKRHDRVTKKWQDKIDYYKAKMIFYDEPTKNKWTEQLKADRNIEIRFAQLQGKNDSSLSSGWTEITLTPNIKYTIPR